MTTKRKSQRKAPRVIDLIISFIAEHGECTQAEICEVLGAEKSSVSEALRLHRAKSHLPNIRIAGQTRGPNNRVAALYAIGDEPDFEMPPSYRSQILKLRLTPEQREDRREDTGATIAAHLDRLRPLAGNVWGVCAAQVGAL